MTPTLVGLSFQTHEEIFDKFRIDSEMEQPKWLEYFKVTPEQYAQAQSRAEAGERTALDLLIEEGKLNEQKYLAFEQKNTKAAYLQTKFFNSNPPIHLWKNLSFKDCRKAMCLPIAEWDGHVIWGKLTTESTSFDNAVPGSVFLLAPCSGLLNYFAKWKEAFNLDAPAEAQVSAPSTTEPSEMPAGLSLQEIPKATLPEVLATVESAQIAPEPDAPTGLSATGPAKVISFELPGNLIAPTNEPAPPLKVATVAAPKPPPALGKPVQAPNVPPPLPTDEVSEVKKGAAPISIKAKSELTTTSVGPAALNLSGVDNQDKWADLLLAEWLKHFDKAVILIREQGGLMVWRWAGPLNASVKSNEIFSLDTPSIFKIVNDTCQPYHGHVTVSSVNDQAFKTLTGGEYPEHITIVPISVQNQVVVQIVGLCTRTKGTKLQLSTLIDLGKAFSQRFIELSQMLKAS